MINAINNLRLKWRAREKDLAQAIIDYPNACPELDMLYVRQRTLNTCITELVEATDIKPRPLNEASTEKLYKWADRMVVILDLVTRAGRITNDPSPGGRGEEYLVEEIGALATRDFLNDIYDLFKQLANRRSE